MFDVIEFIDIGGTKVDQLSSFCLTPYCKHVSMGSGRKVMIESNLY